MELRFGWLVMPLIDARRRVGDVDAGVGRRSRMLAELMPLVSCVWKWIGTPTSSRSAFTSVVGGVGLAQAGHVLDAEDVRAHLLQLLGHA